MSNGFTPVITMEQRRERARRLNAKQSATYAYLIEGEYLNYQQIGDRLGVSRSVAATRHKAATPPITWEKLRCSTHQTNGAAGLRAK
jgi:hypothetical protein